jgi:hypothetical protein
MRRNGDEPIPVAGSVQNFSVAIVKLSFLAASPNGDLLGKITRLMSLKTHEAKRG